MSGLTWFSLSFPPDLTDEQVEEWLRSMSAQRLFRMVGAPPPVIIETVSHGGRLSWRLGLPEQRASGLISALRASAPGVRVEPTSHPGYDMTYGWEVRVQHPFIPLRTDVPRQISTGLLHGLGHGRGKEVVILQWVIGGAVIRKREKLPKPTRDDTDPLRVVADFALDRDDVQALKQKQQEPVFATLGRIAVAGANTPRARQLCAQLFGALELARAPGSGFQRRLMSGRLVAKRMRSFVIPWGAWPCALNASELSGLIAWPYEGPVLGDVSYRSQRQLPASPSVLVPAGTAVDNGRIFGQATFPGREGVLVQRPHDSTLHTWALGPSGQGKSTLLGNLVLQDIAQGRGVVLIEPKGDLVRDVLARLDSTRLDDVVVLDAADPVSPVGINPLTGRHPEVAVDTVLAVFKGLFGDNFGPRTTDLVHAGLLTLTHDPSASLVSLPVLLSDPGYQQRLAPKASKADPWGLAPFWSWYRTLSDEQRAVILAPVMNKLRGLLLRSSLRRVLGQPKPKFDLLQIFTERKILLVSLASGSIGSEGAALLGSLLVGMLWQTIQSRSQVAPERRHPVGLFIDEFQNYLHLPTDLADVLAMSRSYGVGLVAAHQHLGQLTPAIRSAMLANAQSRVLFRLPADDATVMAKTTRHLDAADLEGLERFEAYVSLVSGGAVTPYASARMMALPDPVRDGRTFIERSRARWGTPVEEIDAYQRSLIEPTPPSQSPPVGRKRRGGAS